MSIRTTLYYETLETLRTLEVAQDTINGILRAVTQIRSMIIEINMFMASHPEIVILLSVLTAGREVYTGVMTEEARKARMQEITQKMIDKLTVRE